jgi:hypothetical protein
MLSMKLGLKDLQNQRKIQENQEVTTKIKEGLHHRVENKVSSFFIISIVL